MKHRKLLVYLFPFIITAIYAINHEFASVPELFRLNDVNVYIWVQNVFHLIFEDESTVIGYVSWVVTYSIMFEFAVIIIRLVTFLPKLMDSFIERILGGKYEKV